MFACCWFVRLLVRAVETLTRARTEAAVLGVLDYKLTFWKTYPSEEASQEATSQCHTRSARRVLKALLANGGTCAVRATSDGAEHLRQASSSSSGSTWRHCE